jgi:hypothetical protein
MTPLHVQVLHSDPHLQGRHAPNTQTSAGLFTNDAPVDALEGYFIMHIMPPKVRCATHSLVKPEQSASRKGSAR